MIINLIKKDYFLIKKHLPILLIVAVFSPVIFMFKINDSKLHDTAGMIIFAIVGFVIVLVIANSISQLETTYKKGIAYLTATPYSRDLFVIEKYLFEYVVFGTYCCIYFLVSLVVPKYMMTLDYQIIGLVLMFISLFRNIIIPLEYKFGYENTRYILTLSIVGAPFISSFVMANFQFSLEDFNMLLSINPAIKFICIYGGVLICTLISIMVSVRIFRNKEL